MAGNLVPRSDNTTSIGTIIKRYIKGFFYGLDVKSGVNAPIKTLQRSTAYVVGDVVTTDALHAKYYLKCTTAGTTGSSEPSFTGATSNSTVTDGTAVWTVQTITSAEEVSSSVANTYAPKESPAFTGTPTAPTQVATDDSTKIATTAYVKDNLENYAPLNNPALTGNPTAPTQVASDDSTKIATTEFVHDNTDDKAPLVSPALTGDPTAPTQATTDNSTKIATTAYVKGNLASYAPLANPALTGNPTAPTQGATDNSTKIATTAFVKSNVPASVGSGTKPVYTNSNGKIVASDSNVGDTDTPVYMSGGTITSIGATLFSKIVSHLASATAASISSINTSSLFYRFLTWALTASGVQYNLSNSSAWYICLGSLFGGLIIQGGEAGLTDNYYYIVTPPISFNAVMTAIMIDADNDRSSYQSNSSYSWIPSEGLKFVVTTNLWAVRWLAFGK